VPKKPNYNFEKSKRERDKREKKEEKLRRRKEISDERAAEDAGRAPEDTDEQTS
jgi:hypothetical protein